MSQALTVVTGASSGIGQAVAVQLAATGASLALLSRDHERLAAVADSVAAAGGRASVYPVDLTDDAALGSVAADLAEHRVSALVHSAGLVELGTVARAPVSHLDAQYRVNLRAPFVLTQWLLEPLRASKGHIVFINSSAGLDAKPNWSQYAATKFGLRALADSLRQEVAADGIRVTSVYPGRTASPMQAKVRKLEGAVYQPESYVRSQDVARQVVAVLTTAPPSLITDLTIRPG